jgi:glycogen debranching enzyme
MPGSYIAVSSGGPRFQRQFHSVPFDGETHMTQPLVPPLSAQVDGQAADAHAITVQTSLQELRPRMLKHDDTFAVLNRQGDVTPAPHGPEGLYHRDTRHLSRLQLAVAGAPPLLLSSASADDGPVLTCDLTNSSVAAEDTMVLGPEQIHIRRSKFLRDGTCFERIAVRSYADRPVRVRIDLAFAADFADLFEVRGTHRHRRGEMLAPKTTGDSVTLAYVGLDGARRGTRLRFDPAPEQISDTRAVYAMEIEPGGRQTVLVEVHCQTDASGPGPVEAPRAAFARAIRDCRKAARSATARSTAVITSDSVFDEMLNRSHTDLAMLTTDLPHGPYPYAGIPWFSTVFGRDALVTAWLTLWSDPSLALGVLRNLAAMQATETDPAADSEPGKILHESRNGEMAICGEVPFRRYYGSVDSTPLFVALAGAYLDRTGDAEALRGLWPNLVAALDWMTTHGDRDGDGFLEYGRQTESGLANQGWKDSWDSVSHADGTLAKGPVALCEVQAYAYAAYLAGARISRALNQPGELASDLELRAEILKQRFESAFWSEELGTYALALDGDKRPCLVRASNAGHALLCGIAAPDRADALVNQFLDGGLWSGWGIRTLAVGEVRYNPMSYHNGSVWPHDNALIGLGFARYGHREAAAKLLAGMSAAAAKLDLRRLPELFCGFARRAGRGPTGYPVACAPQAWAAATPIGLLGACLGITFDPARRMVRLERPVLPAGLDSLTLHGLTIGDASIDIALSRLAGGSVSMSVIGRHGDIGATLIG